MDEPCNDEKNKNRRKALLTGGLAHVIHDGFTDMLYVFFPIWQAQFSLSFTEIGLLKTLFSGTMAGFQIPAGMLASRIGEIRLLLIGTVLTSSAILLLGWSATPILLGCLLIVGGLGESVQHPLSSSLISKVYIDPKERRTALSTFNVAGDIGKLILPAAAATLITEYNWQTASHLLGAVGMVVAVFLFLLSRKFLQVSLTSTEEKFQAGGSSIGWKGYQSFWSLSVIGIIDSATRMGFLTFFPFLLQEKGAGVATIGLALSLVFAGGATGKLVCGRLATKLGILRTVITTEVVTALSIWGILILPLHTALMLSPVLGIALNGTSSVLYGSVPELVSEEHCKQAFAIFYTATIGAGAVSPFLYGMASDIISIKMAVVLIGFIVLVILPLTIPLKGKLVH
jgi:FSR family fosmidomycin resistance protein-like MFS transporter